MRVVQGCSQQASFFYSRCKLAKLHNYPHFVHTYYLMTCRHEINELNLYHGCNYEGYTF